MSDILNKVSKLEEMQNFLSAKFDFYATKTRQPEAPQKAAEIAASYAQVTESLTNIKETKAYQAADKQAAAQSIRKRNAHTR